MKVSLSWVFDHIHGSVHEIDVSDLVVRFNETVAEIEAYYTWHFTHELFDFIQVMNIKKDCVTVRMMRADTVHILPKRNDLLVGDIALIKHEESPRWARMTDMGSSKETLLPSVDPRYATWDRMETSDTILVIDNKSITHRPDLWSHRGLAREVAALLGLHLTDESDLFDADTHLYRFFDTDIQEQSGLPSLTIAKHVPCRRLAGAYVSTAWSPSIFFILSRLARLDTRPIDTLVDFTNYVMFDYGQPMHAFDAQKLLGNNFSVRHAYVGEAITLLDGDFLTLHAQDMVLADMQGALSLVGVMGGAHSSISRTTKSILIEAGSFEPSAIRHTVGRYAKRTEAAMRFEKNLDPEMPASALKRYIAILTHYNIHHDTLGIIDYGPAVKPVDIILHHTMIEQRLGMHLSVQTACSILQALDFQVQQDSTHTDTQYTVRVPTFRATKDIRIPEDIVEEIGRYVGYKNIPMQLPSMVRSSSVADSVYRLRTLKNYCASTLHMREVSTYAFYDESWLSHLHWQPANMLEVLNPVSGNWPRLVTSLVPALLKAVHENSEGIADIRYFEVGRSWQFSSPVIEKKQLAGVVYTRSTTADFYTLKESVQQLCAQIGITVSWQRAAIDDIAAWYDPYCVAHCCYEDTIIGTVGLAAQPWKERVVQTGYLGIFELNADFLLSVQMPIQKYKALPKYPDIVRDVSVYISQAIPAHEIQNKIQAMDTRICEVTLIDFFKKPEWRAALSLSFRYVIRDNNKTLTTHEADEVSNAVVQMLITLGGEIR